MFIFSASYSSVPAVHLIATVYTTVVRTRECVCVRVVWNVSLVSCACEGEGVAVLCEGVAL